MMILEAFVFTPIKFFHPFSFLHANASESFSHADISLAKHIAALFGFIKKIDITEIKKAR
jgi:hypothetical protein